MDENGFGEAGGYTGPSDYGPSSGADTSQPSGPETPSPPSDPGSFGPGTGLPPGATQIADDRTPWNESSLTTTLRNLLDGYFAPLATPGRVATFTVPGGPFPGMMLDKIGEWMGPQTPEQRATLAAQVPPGAFGGGQDDRGGEPFRAPTAVQQAIQQAIAKAVTGGSRGAIGEMPEFLRPELTGLSPFQQRAAIGTYGPSSESGRYRDPQTIDYYKSLVENTLKNEMGIPISSPLPIEWQFLREVLGVSPPETTEAFLSSLANYQTPI